MSQVDSLPEALQAISEAQASPTFKHLHDYLGLHYDLLRAQHEAGIGLCDAAANDERGRELLLEGRLPRIAFTELPVEPESFALLVGRLLDICAHFCPDVTSQVEDLGARTMADLLEQAQQILCNTSAAWGLAALPDLGQAVTSLALTPYLRWVAAQLSTNLDTGAWNQGICPLCGGHPDWSFLGETSGERQLVCGRCDTHWFYPRVQCPFCYCTDRQRLGYYLSADGGYRLYTCDQCHRYIKARDLRLGGSPVPYAVERILTIEMDVTAQEGGYRSL